MELSFPLIVNYFIDTFFAGQGLGTDHRDLNRVIYGVRAQLGSSVYRDLLGTHAWYQY